MHGSWLNQTNHGKFQFIALMYCELFNLDPSLCCVTNGDKFGNWSSIGQLLNRLGSHPFGQFCAVTLHSQVFAYAGDRLILISQMTDNNEKWIPSEVDVLVNGQLCCMYSTDGRPPLYPSIPQPTQTEVCEQKEKAESLEPEDYRMCTLLLASQLKQGHN